MTARLTPASAAALPPDLQDAWSRAESAEASGSWAAAREHYAWLLYALPRDTDPRFAATLVRRTARAFIEEANFDAAIDCLAVALTTAEAIGDERALAHARNLLGIVEQRRGRLESAERHYREARAAAQHAADVGL